MALFKEFNENSKPAEEASADSTATSVGGGETGAKVQAIVDELRPYLQADGGDVELLKVEDNIAYVRLVGACVGCPSSTMTLKRGIEARICEAVPEIEAVEMV